MLSKEEFESLINALREKLDDTTNALISDELLNIVSVYTTAYDEYASAKEETDKLKEEKDELLKVNGKLFQKIGFDKPEEETKDGIEEESAEEELTVEDVIDEKGDMI
jgi:hypothetical protein